MLLENLFGVTRKERTVKKCILSSYKEICLGDCVVKVTNFVIEVIKLVIISNTTTGYKQEYSFYLKIYVTFLFIRTGRFRSSTSAKKLPRNLWKGLR